jgi:hypothetical protein
MGDELTFSPVAELVELITTAGLQAAQDPAELNMPGAWVTVDQIVPSSLGGGWEIKALVFLIVQDNDYARASDQLAEAFNMLHTVVEPDGPVLPQGVLMPGDPTPLPALRVPVSLYTT